MPKQSITEKSNELTTDIDIAEPLGIVRLLRQTDSQIYNGYSTYPGLCDKEIILKIEDCIKRSSSILNAKGKKIIVISGAGTSGRLAMFIAKTFNQMLQKSKKQPIFRYLIAGGNKALIAAQEGAEDNTKLSETDLETIIGDAKLVGYFGVTAGLSAPYVAGQMDYMMNQLDRKVFKGFACLVGFNPVERARNIPIENWDKTFLQIAMKANQHEDCIILNPVVGPEPITGSTRMKSGSVTKLLLEVVFHQAIQKKKLDLIKFLQQYENTRVAVYQEAENISRLIQMGGETFQGKGHIYYLGKVPYGIIGLVDASECPPTYGADFEDVRGFLEGGWDALLGKGNDLSNVGPLYRIGIDEFINNKLPQLNKNDLVIALGDGKIAFAEILQKVRKKGAKTACIAVQNKSLVKSSKPNYIDVMIQPVIPGLTYFKEYGVKLILNGITTGAHVRIGKVYQNRMIDLKISNNKLYYRTLQIISSIMKVDEETAKQCTLKAIYETDSLTPEIVNAKISDYVSISTPKQKVVPKAMLMATGKFNLQSATQTLSKEPIVRNIIKKLVEMK